MPKTDYIDVIMHTPPGPDSDFIEVEDDTGRSIRAGEWFQDNNGYWRLRITPEAFDAK